MKRFILIGSVLAITIFNANARINDFYQRTLVISDYSVSEVQPITNNAITLNPDIDDIDASDPRIRSVIDYVRTSGKGVSIIFFNTDNLRYVKKVNELFNTNHIFTDSPQLTKTTNLVDYNLIKIYVIKENHNVSTPISAR